jgi:hypothetical protein
MNITDIRTRVDAQNERSRLVTRGAEPNVGPDEPVLTLVDNTQRSEAECSIMTDPLIQALVNKLPPPSSIWSIDGRVKWLKALAMLCTELIVTNKSSPLLPRRPRTAAQPKVLEE